MLPAFFYQTPFFRFLLPFVAGIILGFEVRHTAEIWLLLTCIVLAACLFCVQWNWKKSSRQHVVWLFGLLLHLLLFAAGLYSVSLNRFVPSQQQEHGAYLVVVEEPPVERENSMKAILLVKEAFPDSSSREIRKEKIIAYFRKDTLSKIIRQGDLLIMDATLQPVINAGNPYEFDYQSYLERQAVGRSAFVESNKWRHLDSYAQGPIVNFSNRIRNQLLDIYKRGGIEGNELAVASALTLGYKADLSADLRTAYSASGAMHVLAVSGLHVGILYLILIFLLKQIPYLQRNKWLLAAILLAALWLYAFIPGLPPSVKRATAMFSIIVIGQAFHRRSYIYNSIAASAFLLLLLNPAILFDVGFQLSHTALLAIVFIHPKIHPLLSFNHLIFDKAWNLTCVSIAAQIGTGPLVLYYFHQFPTYFMLANFIVIPAATVVIYGALALFVLSPVPQLLECGGWLYDKVLYALNYCIFFIEKLPGSVLANIRFHGWEILLCYMLVATVSAWLLLQRKAYLFCTLGLCLLWFSGTTIREYRDLSRHQLIVMNVQGNSLFMFIDARSNAIWYKSNKPSFDPGRSTSEQRIATHSGNAQSEPLDSVLHRSGAGMYQLPTMFKNGNFILFGNKRLAIFTRQQPPQDTVIHVLKTDVVVLAQNVNIQIQQIMQAYTPEIIVIDASNSPARSERWEKDCEQAGMKCHRVSRDRAYILNAD